MRCLLVAPRTAITSNAHFGISMELDHIASKLKPTEPDVMLLKCDCPQRDPGNLSTTPTKDSRPDVSMVHGITPRYPQQKLFLGEAKSLAMDNPRFTVGVLLTSGPEFMLNHFPAGIGAQCDGLATVEEPFIPLKESSTHDGIRGLTF